MANKGNSKLCQTSEIELFLQATEANSESRRTFKMRFSAKIVKNQKPLTIFGKPPSSMFAKVLTSE